MNVMLAIVRIRFGRQSVLITIKSAVVAPAPVVTANRLVMSARPMPAIDVILFLNLDQERGCNRYLSGRLTLKTKQFFRAHVTNAIQ